ncbi:DUF4232 domain-containing protein [Streptomyces griseocarneus]|uniref:DUF4232 domain-containing protein n=1 Tax=Streptomyces griseocarneus TaxID=51201 RepID=UPI00167D52C4|nr:DUF4232 domain-containing protein [Streptomyces griseocarneus]MBZ6472881.1 DUF4232 domain-containing protein [Streptomyces griseocarneus]GHG58588.1 hypothetical protein GCM10018779_24300 [Streptomyces griseocarneus]
MRASVRRPRLLAATFAIAALALTACSNGGGVREEGAASQSSGAVSQDTTAPKPDGPAGSAPHGANGTSSVSPGKAGQGGRAGRTGKGGGSAAGAAGDPDAPENRVPCTAGNTKVVATPVSRPLNHMLLTITNTGSRMCDLKGYPIVKFEGAQSVPPVMAHTKPQAVTSLPPGQSGYASVILSAGDGSGGEGRTARSLEIGFQGSDGMARATLPAEGVHIDDSLRVSYWLTTAEDALS